MRRIFLCFAMFLLSTPSVYADLVGFMDDFANTDGAPGTTTPSGWTVVSGNTTFLLESGDADDGALLDLVDDGYASLNGNVTANGGNFSPMVTRDFGVVMASDVGSTIDLDISYLEVSIGGNVTGGIASNGSFIASVVGSTFGADPNNGQLGLSYTVTSADVGSTFAAKFQFFSSQDGRTIGLDTVNVNVSAVPEPSGFILFAIVGCATCMRRKRS